MKMNTYLFQIEFFNAKMCIWSQMCNANTISNGWTQMSVKLFLKYLFTGGYSVEKILQ